MNQRTSENLWKPSSPTSGLVPAVATLDRHDLVVVEEVGRENLDDVEGVAFEHRLDVRVVPPVRELVSAQPLSCFRLGGAAHRHDLGVRMAQVPEHVLVADVPEADEADPEPPALATRHRRGPGGLPRA